MVGMLWPISDVDCDAFNVELFNKWLFDDGKKEPDLVRAVAETRTSAKQFVTVSAIVVYGLPVQVKHVTKDT